MSMTRKHYQTIANNFATEVKRIRKDGVSGDMPKTQAEETLMVLFRTAYKLADDLKADNSRFDRERFLDACGFI